jgi:hypothetical protein
MKKSTLKILVKVALSFLSIVGLIYVVNLGFLGVICLCLEDWLGSWPLSLQRHGSLFGFGRLKKIKRRKNEKNHFISDGDGVGVYGGMFIF